MFRVFGHALDGGELPVREGLGGGGLVISGAGDGDTSGVG